MKVDKPSQSSLLSPLQSSSILVTRPKHQAATFQKMLETAGASVTLFPTLDIIPLPLEKQLFQHQAFDILIFTSPNAVNFSLPFLKQSSIDLATTSIGAIGKKTATTLEEKGISVDLLPAHTFNSETFLELPSLQYITRKNILLIKGEGGRSHLSEQLQKRGANVNVLNSYRRACPSPTQQSLNKLKIKKIDIITFTSVEAATNLFNLLCKQEWLKRTILLVGSTRIRDALIKCGINNTIWIANNPSDEAMFQTLLINI